MSHSLCLLYMRIMLIYCVEPTTGSTVEALASSGSTSYLGTLLPSSLFSPAYFYIVFPPRPISHYSHHKITSECATPLATSYVVTEGASDKGGVASSQPFTSPFTSPSPSSSSSTSSRSLDPDPSRGGDKWPKIYMVHSISILFCFFCFFFVCLFVCIICYSPLTNRYIFLVCTQKLGTSLHWNKTGHHPTHNRQPNHNNHHYHRPNSECNKRKRYTT